MSKQLIAVILVLGAFCSTNAFASRARLLVFGTGDGGLILGDNGSNGSFYTDDAYNMFYNPSYVVDYKNFGIIEKSNYSSAYSLTGLNTATGTNGGATAEGGFVTSISNFSLGVFMNRTDAVSDAFYSHPGDMRPIDLMIGGDMGWKWGVGLTYTSYKATPVGGTSQSTDADLVARVGIQMNDFEPFAWYRFAGTNHFVPNGLNTNSEKNKMYAIGAKYHWGEWTPFAAFKKTKLEDTTVNTIFGGGFGRNTKINETVKLAYSLAFFRQSTGDFSGLTVANRGELNPSRSIVPINVAVEGDALTWLTLRAGLGYNLVDQTSTGTPADQTSGRIGATFHFNKVDFDWAVGKTGLANENSTDSNSQNFDIASGFFTAAALSFHW